MKRILSLAFGLFLAGVVFGTPLSIELRPTKVDPTPSMPAKGKSPVQTPSLELDGHELIFQSSHPGYSISIIQNGMVVYSADVDEITTSITLPSWLSGEYEIELFPEGSSYYFIGEISL